LKRSIKAACALGAAAALVALPADAATRHYAGPELCTPFGYNADYAPHSFRVCTTTKADYRSKTKHNTVKVSGKGHTEYLFNASVYHFTKSFDYSYRFEVRKGHPSTVVLKESETYSVGKGVVCTVTVDLAFTDGVLVSADPSNYCPDSDGPN
jgi:hypothetical protein